MAGNYGIGIGAFADGFARGMGIGQRYREASKEWEAEDVRRKALDEANKERNATVATETNRLMGIGEFGPPEPGAAQPQQPAAPTAQPADMAAPPAAQMPQQPADPEPSQVAPSKPALPAAAGLPPMGKAPMSREAAQAQAEKSAPSVMEFFQKKGVPKVAEMYLAQGNAEKAQAWTKWAEDAENQRSMKLWAKAWRASQMGDVEGAADHFMDLYKRYDDGMTPVSKEIVKDKDGNITGFNVKLRNDDTGEERAAFIDPKQLQDFGLSALSPPQMFEAVEKRRAVAEKARTDAAAKAGEARMKLASDIALEQTRQGGRVALEGIKHDNDLERDQQRGQIDAGNQRNKVQQELDAKIGALQKAGYSEEFINGVLPEVLGVSTHKKGASPEEARRLAMSDRMKNDPSFARMPAEKQRSIIEQDMNLIYGGMKSSTVGSPKSGSPSSGGIGAAPGASPRGKPFLDTQTGKVVYR